MKQAVPLFSHETPSPQLVGTTDWNRGDLIQEAATHNMVTGVG